MTKQTRTLVLAGLGVVALLAAYTGYQRTYVRPREAIEAKIRGVESDAQAREEASDQTPVLRKRLRELAAHTLGSDEETVAAAMRTSLNEITRHFHLSSPTVSTRRAEGIRNPAAAKAGDFTDRASKGRADFFAMEASVRAVGNLEAVLKTLATLERQPWVHRVDQWTITPIDKTRERFEFTVDLTSAFLPEADLRPAGSSSGTSASGPAWEPVTDEQFAEYRPILARAVFRTPPADAPPSPPPVRVAGPAAPMVPPYEEWKVTGVVKGRTGWELWVRNAKSGQSMTLFPGDRVLDAKFLEATGEMATLEISGSRFVVALGQTLGDRRPVSQ